MQIKKECVIGNTIFKKLFFENAAMSKRDKEIFTKDIEKILWQYALKEENTRIPAFRDEVREYEEIAIIEVVLSEEKHTKRIGAIIQATIPYPMILSFDYKDQVKLNLANKRVNQSDRTKNTVEYIIETDWLGFANLSQRENDFISAFKVENCSYYNLYAFYLDLIKMVQQFNISKITDDFKGIAKKDVTIVKWLQQKVEVTEAEIDGIRKQLKNEVHFNKKMDMNIAIKKLEQKKQKLINELNEGTPT
jgi:hypothetical protein